MKSPKVCSFSRHFESLKHLQAVIPLSGTLQMWRITISGLTRMKDLNISNDKWFFTRIFLVYWELFLRGAVPRKAATWLYCYSRCWAAKNDRSTWFTFGTFRKIRFLWKLVGFLPQKSLMKSVKIVGKFSVVETRPNYSEKSLELSNTVCFNCLGKQ